MNQVFSTTELLEAILLYLNTKDLLLSQNVSRKFRDTVKGSVHLQRALFLTENYMAWSEDQIHSRPQILNPLFADLTGDPSPPLLFKLDGPGFQLSYLQLSDIGIRSSDLNGGAIPIMDTSIISIRRCLTKNYRVIKPGSWEDMFLTQPPSRVLIKLPADNESVFALQTGPTKLGDVVKGIAQIAEDRVDGEIEGKFWLL